MKENPMIKHALTKSNGFKWVHFGDYVDIKRKGCQPTALATIKTKKVKETIKKQNDYNEEEETSQGEEELDEDIDKDKIQEPLKKIAQIDPTKKIETLKVPTLYDSDDYLKNLSSTNLKNSPKPKAATSKITSY
jgi:hypothetical protein